MRMLGYIATKAKWQFKLKTFIVSYGQGHIKM